MATHQQQSELSSKAVSQKGSAGPSDSLWVEIEVNKTDHKTCPAAGHFTGDVSGDIQLIGDQCHAALGHNDGSQETRMITTTIEESCTCPMVCEPGISPANLHIEAGSLVLETVVESRERLQRLSDQLHDTEDEWHLHKLQPISDRSPGDSDVVQNLSEEISLTSKQEEVVRLAVGRGYYANPREASLGELADEIGVTRAALSQRLNAVEAKLIDTLAGEL